jgi:Calcineurin-like phosphoesterase
MPRMLVARIAFFCFYRALYRLAAVEAQSVSSVPGNAEWLGDYGSGEDIPNITEYLPYSYVVFGSGVEVIPRLLVPLDRGCPEIIADNNGTDSTVELPIPASVTRAVGDTNLPYAFPVRVCEVRITLESHKKAWTAGTLRWEGVETASTPIPLDPTRFLLIGDTGLRVKPKDLGLGKCKAAQYPLYDIEQCEVNFTQADLNASTVKGDFQSTDESSWPLRTLQTYASLEEADVVVYVGDYVYRQGPCPEGSNVSCVAINGPPRFDVSDLEANNAVANFLPGTWGDNLYGWWADLFWPALELFKAAPVIAVRGNHEICTRAGHGYFLFFDVDEYPEDTVAGQYCEDYIAPRAVSFANEQFLVFDDSYIAPMNGGIDHYNFSTYLPCLELSFCSALLPLVSRCPAKGACPQAPTGTDPPLVAAQTPRYDDPTQSPAEIQAEIDRYATMMESVRNLSLSHDTNFYASHRAPFAVACNGSILQSLDWTVQQSLGLNTFDKVSACIAGHMHWLLVLLYDTLPHQIVVGHGGTSLIPNYVNQNSLPGLVVEAGKDSMFRGIVKDGMSSSLMHGYAIMERRDDGDYSVTFRGLNATLEMEDLNVTMVVPRGPRVRESSPTLPPVDYPTATAPPSSSSGSESPVAPPTTTSNGSAPISFSVSCLAGSLALLNALLG